MERFRLEVGHTHGVKPGNIVGAIANEADIDSEHIGRIEIFDDHSTIDLPEGMPKDLFKHLKSVWVSGQRLQISRLEPGNKPPPPAAETKRKPGKGKDKNKGKPKSNKGSAPRDRDNSDTRPAVRQRPAK